jgi:hypothetical protein
MTYINSFVQINQAFSTNCTKHITSFNQIINVLWRLILVGNFYTLKFMGMLYISLIAFLAIAKIIASLTIESILSCIYCFETFITCIPCIIALCCLLIISKFFYRFSNSFFVKSSFFFL